MPKQNHRAVNIVADGHLRARRALEPVIRAEVEQEFSEELRQAGLWQRCELRREIEREIERRIAAVAPPDALY